MHKTVSRPATTQPAASARSAPPKSADSSLATRLESPYATRFMVMGGLNLFRTREGRWVEMPDDFTVEEAIQLESEALRAQQKLGQGPPPEPVPNVKKLARKEGNKDKPKAPAKGKKPQRAQAKPPPSGAALTALLKEVGASPVARYLAARGAPALSKGVGMLQTLKKNEQTHDDAPEKLRQTEMAVVVPPVEGQSKSNTGQVGQVTARPVPVAGEKRAKQKLRASLQANAPRTIEDVDHFKRDAKAQHMGADVLLVVQSDKNAVVSTFGEIGQTPAPLPPDHNPVDLPPQEAAPPTPMLHLGQGAIAPLPKEHTDLSAYTQQADHKLREEGITQEQLDLVDSGDLAAANKEKKGMEVAVKTEPLAVQQFALQASARIEVELKQDEKRDRDALKAKRQAGLSATSRKQKGAKRALEKKREEVANKINDIYSRAQNSVKKKLADLETQSMKRFDDGHAQATKDFEDNVNRDIEAFKDDRYSGWFGWARRARDWLLGIDDLPEVKAIFERHRAHFVSTIDRLVESITADSRRVIQECKTELDQSKEQIQEFVAKLEPSLQGIGKAAAEEMNAKLAGLDQFVSRKEQDLQNKLKDKQTAAIKAIDEKIEKMKEAMSGALAKLGRLLLWAAKKFFTWALSQFGYSLEDIESIINKGVAVLKAIFTQPIRFVKNLFSAASNGFQNFAKNFPTHLKDAVFEWLTGSLEGIQLPSSWTLRGIASVAFQMLGLTWRNIRGKLASRVGERTVQAMEESFELVKTLYHEGPIAAWEKLKEMADEIKKAFIEGIKDFIKIKIVQEAVKTVIALIVPGAGIIRAVVAIYDTIVFFIQKAKDIAQMIGNFLSSIGEIAAGNIAAAADALEQGLARALSLVIHFLVRFLRLGGITAKIRASIQKLRDKVDSMLDRVAEWIADKARKLWGKAKAAGRKMVNWAWSHLTFAGEDGKSHKLYILDREGQPRLILESTPIAVRHHLVRIGPEVAAITDKNKKARFESLVGKATTINNDIETDINTLENTPDHVGQGKLQKSIQVNSNRLAPILSQLAGASASGADLPALLPPMQNNVKARSAMAEFLTRRNSAGAPNFRHGTEASAYSGATLGGWKILQASGLTTASRYVKMHLLPSRLGGDAVDSNLTPAPGDVNLDFSRNVEMPGWRAAATDYVWYRTTIDYHGGNYPQNAFPSFIASEWGDYDKSKKPWTRNQRKSPGQFYSASIPLPSLPPGLDINAAPDRAIADFFNISKRIAQLIVRLRRNNPFGSALDVINALTQWFADPSHVRPEGWEDDVAKASKQLLSKSGQIQY